VAAAADESMSFRGCRVVWCNERGIVSPVPQAGHPCGEGQGLHCVHTASAILDFVNFNGHSIRRSR